MIVSNIMGPKPKPPNSIQFYSTTPELDVISIQMCTLNVTLNPTTRAIFCISVETTQLNSMYFLSTLLYFFFDNPDNL